MAGLDLVIMLVLDLTLTGIKQNKTKKCTNKH